MFDFKITQRSAESRARLGIFSTPHGDIHTPVFMPVGTKATVKALDDQDLEALGTEIILANTYHLAMRPGGELVARMGGLHKWMHWDKPILTDSGGFQVFSLKALRKITDNEVEFQSHLDGNVHVFTPEKVMQIQEALGADIIMAFDECIAGDANEEEARKAMERTHRWTERCLAAKTRSDQAIFPIIQGSHFKNLREESARFIAGLNTPGIAIGGVSVGESYEQKFSSVECVLPFLPEEKPHYLMGIGTPDDLLESVERGMDMFDCVLPTRLARHGAFWDNTGRHSLFNEQYKFDSSPLETSVPHRASREFSKSYVRHLMVENEISGIRLLSMHNLAFLFHLMVQIRYHIEQGSFLHFKKDFLSHFHSTHDSTTSGPDLA